MKYKFFLFYISLIISSVTFTQKKLDTINRKGNSIFFADVNFGYAYFSEHAASAGVSFNYQKKINLYKFRFVQHEYIEKVKFLAIIPYSKTSLTYNEYSLLYGKRIIRDDISYHFAIGASYNYLNYTEDNISVQKDFFYGVPLEIGFLRFNSNRKRYRVFGLIPVGKPTSFGRATGVKIVANLAKQSYVGIHLTVGLGWYKNYKNE